MLSGATKVGSVFSSERNIQIVLRSVCFDQFKAELNNLNFTHRDDFNRDYKLCQEKFLHAEQPRPACSAGKDKDWVKAKWQTQGRWNFK